MIDTQLLIYYREKNNLTTGQLSRKIHIPRKYIEQWELGDLLPRVSDIEKLCKLYGIEEDDLYKEVKMKYDFAYISIVLIILGLILGLLNKSIMMIILLPTTLFGTYNIGRIVLKEFKVTSKIKEEIPKSVFGMVLDTEYKVEREKCYTLEANLISNIYVLVNMVFKIFKLDNLILNINVLEDINNNQLLSMVIVYILLTIITFIIEYIIGERMVKKYKENI